MRGARPELPAGLAADIAAGVAFLQARPQTRPLEEALKPGETWTRTNVSDTVPEVTSAISRAKFVVALDRLLHDVYRRIGLPLPPEVPLAAAGALGAVVLAESQDAECTITGCRSGGGDRRTRCGR